MNDMAAHAQITPRAQKAVAHFLKHGVRSRAYIAAGYRTTSDATTRSAASRLFANVNVQAVLMSRLDELRQRVGERVHITRETVIRDLEALKHQAADLDDPSPAIKATELQGRAIGMFRDADGGLVRRASADELIAAIAGGDADLAAALRSQLANPATVIDNAPDTAPIGAVIEGK